MRQNINALNSYLEEIGNYPLLNLEEERYLFAKYSRFSGEDKEKVRDIIFNSNLRLVLSIARKYQNCGLDLLDLIQEGNLGLIKAIEKYSCEKDTKFSTYATYWIRQAITRAISNTGRNIRLPLHVQTTINKILQKERELILKLEREPSDDELARALEMSVSQLNEYRSYAFNTKSLDDVVGDDLVLMDTVRDYESEDVLFTLELEEQALMLHNALKELSSRERDILVKHFGLFNSRRYSLEEIGDIHSLTRERIRQIERASLSKMKRILEQKAMDYIS